MYLYLPADGLMQQLQGVMDDAYMDVVLSVGDFVVITLFHLAPGASRLSVCPDGDSPVVAGSPLATGVLHDVRVFLGALLRP